MLFNAVTAHVHGGAFAVHDASAARQPTPPPRGSAGGPLAMWNVVKAAYQQNALDRSNSSADSQHGGNVSATASSPKQHPWQQRQQQVDAAVSKPDPMDFRAATATGTEVATAGLQQCQGLGNSSSSRDLEVYQRQSSMSGGPRHLSVQRGGSFKAHKGTLGQRLCEPRPTLGRRLSNASAFAASAGSSFSDNGANECETAPMMSVAARTAACIRSSLQLSHSQQQQVQQYIGEAMLVDGQQYSTLVTEPSLVTKSVSLGRRSQQGLSRRSASAGLARNSASLTRKSPVDLRRPSTFIPGVGTGLFQSNIGG